MSELQRYGLEWKSDTDFIATPMSDGYWTPWHIAQERLATTQAENEALRARVEELEEEMELFTAMAVMICQQESDEWDSDRLQTYKDYAEVCGQRIAKIAPVNARALLLRKQAEAVEKFGQEIGVFDPEYDDQEYVEVPRREVKAYAQRLRQQADEAERAGGEHA